jgi:6-phosphogluconolactonase
MASIRSRIAAIFIAGLLVPGTAAILKHPPKPEYFVYAGTYTGPASKGIYAFRFNSADGTISSLGLAAELRDPAFLAVHPSNKFLYAVTDNENGSITSFAVNHATGGLRLINTAPTKVGPCYVTVDHKGWMLLVSNYGSGNVESFRIEGDGGLGESTALQQLAGSSIDPKRQTSPHPHAVVISPDNFFVFVPDLGLDKIFSYRFDPARVTFWPNNPAFVAVKPGAGPRHLAFRPDEKFAYAVDEIGSSVTAFTYNRDAGSLKLLESVSTLPDNFSGENSAAEIEIDPSGRFLYVSNRGDDSIVVFFIDGKNGTLKQIQRVSTQGKTPRNFRLDPTGGYLFAANQNSNTIVIFEIDRKTGLLTSTGKVLDVPSPVCIQFVPVSRS